MRARPKGSVDDADKLLDQLLLQKSENMLKFFGNLGERSGPKWAKLPEGIAKSIRDTSRLSELKSFIKSVF